MVESFGRMSSVSSIRCRRMHMICVILCTIIMTQMSFRLGFAGTGTCNYAGINGFVPNAYAVGFCDQELFTSFDLSFECQGGTPGSVIQVEYEEDSGCTGRPFEIDENVNGICDASDTGCNLYLVRSRRYVNDDCTGGSTRLSSIVITDGAANVCADGVEISNIDLNGYTITRYAQEDCSGSVIRQINYINNGCGAVTGYAVQSIYTEISQYPGPLYEGVGIPMNYQDAQDYCQNTFETQLATIHSEEENEEARIIADEMGANGDLLWIGLNRLDGANGFDEWDDESDVDYTNFYQFGPGIVHVNGPVKDCIAINGDKNDQWVPRTCDNQFPFVCNHPDGLYGNVPKPI